MTRAKRVRNAFWSFTKIVRHLDTLPSRHRVNSALFWDALALFWDASAPCWDHFGPFLWDASAPIYFYYDF